MIHRPTWIGSVLAAALLSLAVFAGAQETTVKKAPIKPSNPSSGAGMYKQYCAVCHGVDGKGDGPAAPDLKIAPPDLTTLAKRHDGKFPDDYVATVLRNGAKAPAHGNTEMPVWGPLFETISHGDQGLVTMRISNMTRYLKSIQAK